MLWQSLVPWALKKADRKLLRKVGYYGFGHAMKAIDFLNKEVSYCGSKVRVGKGNKMSIFCQAINHNKDDVFPARFGQSLYEAKGNVLPNGGRNWERLQ